MIWIMTIVDMVIGKKSTALDRANELLFSQCILVTGGTRGIGQSIADYFSRPAYSHITGKSDSFNNTRLPSVRYHQLDLTCKESTFKFLRDIRNERPIDVLINNAGINKINCLDKIQQADLEAVIAVNTLGPVRVTQALAETMPNGGRIVNIGSIWGSISKGGRIAYSTSKSALLGLTRGLATELAPKGILVNLVSPGFVDTELTRASLSDEEINTLTARCPFGRLAEPNEIAKVVAFV